MAGGLMDALLDPMQNPVTYAVPFFLLAMLVVLGVDLGYYWHHRFSHRVRIAWAGHQAHHSSEFMNFGTALRQKWNPWFEFFFWLPLPLLGFAPWTLYAAFGVNLIFDNLLTLQYGHYADIARDV